MVFHLFRYSVDGRTTAWSPISGWQNYVMRASLAFSALIIWSQSDNGVKHVSGHNKKWQHSCALSAHVSWIRVRVIRFFTVTCYGMLLLRRSCVCQCLKTKCRTLCCNLCIFSDYFMCRQYACGHAIAKLSTSYDQLHMAIVLLTTVEAAWAENILQGVQWCSVL